MNAGANHMAMQDVADIHCSVSPDVRSVPPRSGTSQKHRQFFSDWICRPDRIRSDRARVRTLNMSAAAAWQSFVGQRQDGSRAIAVIQGGNPETVPAILPRRKPAVFCDPLTSVSQQDGRPVLLGRSFPAPGWLWSLPRLLIVALTSDIANLPIV